MKDYQTTPFCGEWDEDPEIFLGWFLQCMGTADDKTKAHKFIYYLQANSDADEWFEDLPEEEKGSWVRIERLFRREWLKEEEISIKDSESVTTSKNIPEPTSTHLTLPSATSSTPMKFQTTPTTLVTTSQLPELPGNQKTKKKKKKT